MNMSLNSSMDDDDDDFDFYNNPIAQFNKIKEQKEKEAAMKRKRLEKKLDELDASMTEDKSKDETEVSSSNKVQLEGLVIEITDSQSPKINDVEIPESPPKNQGLRRSTRNRGRGRGQKNAITDYFTVSETKKNSRKNSLDRELQQLEEVASQLKATTKSKNVPLLHDSPVLIDSDDECEADEIVNVKVVWRQSEPYSFPIVKKKDLGSIYEFFAKRENVSIQKILLSKKDQVLSPHCTPLSIEYKVTDILEGGILEETVNNQQAAVNKQQDKNCIEVKVQQKNVKKPLLIQLHKSNDMHILAKKVAAELGIDIEKLKFNFDGDLLDLDETVESLDLDGGECFDLVIIS
uniref:Uncharacterized protein CG4449 n=2 Tax=Cacopsylla melanoneura TaxID=428564 RepID=A0A8D8ZUT3_9HEMI